MNAAIAIAIAVAITLMGTAANAATVLFVTSGSSPNAGEGSRIYGLQSYGYIVTTIQDSSSQASFDSAMASATLVYIPSTIQEYELQSKVKNTTIGVICEHPYMDVYMGFSTNLGWTASHNNIEIIDNTHAVTSGFGTGYVTIVNTNQPLSLMNSTVAPGMTILAKQNYAAGNAMGVIEAGDMLADGTVAAGRRARLPWGGSSFNINELNSNGQLLAIQAINWAATSPAATRSYDVLLVTAGSTLTSEESARQTQFEDWGFTVTTIEDSDTEDNFKTALESCDVVYVPQSINVDSLAYKLRTAKVGVVHEAISSLDDNVGWTTSTGYNSNTSTTMTITDNTHPVTDGLSTGTISIYSSSTDSYGAQINGTLASGAETLGTNLGVNSGLPNLVVFDAGDELASSYNSNSTAKGRRVHLPFGGFGTFSWSNLTLNSKVMIFNALEWAAEPMLAGHWRLDETSGTTATDSSRNANDATVTGTTTWGSAVRQNGFTFDGSTEIRATGLSGESANVTLAAWVKLTATGTSGYEVISIGDHFGIRVNQAGTTYAFIYNGSNWDFASTTEPFAGEGWRHIAAVFDDDADTLTIYVDGQEVASSTITNSIVYSGLGSDTLIGVHGNGDASWNFTGSIDDARVYSYALTAKEIAELYGLVGHWKLDESSGSIAYDSSGVGNDGDYLGGAAPGANGPYPGDGANAAEFDGSTAYVRVAHDEIYDIEEGITLAAWVQADAIGYFKTVIAKGDSAWRLHMDDMNDRLTGHYSMEGGGTVSGVDTTSTVSDGEWMHVVSTYDGTTAKIYVNGVLEDSGIATATIDTNTAPVCIGQNSQKGGRYWNGRIADVRVYNRAITEAEIAKIYGLVAHWKLDELSGTIAYDSSGMENHATVVGSQGWTTGQVDGGFYFDYADGEEYIEAPTNTMLDDLQEHDYTISLWYNPGSVPPGTSPENDMAYGLLMKTGWHEGLYYSSTRFFAMDHWLTGGAWNGAGAWTESFRTGYYHHVVGVVSSVEGTVDLYVDGVLYASSTFTPGTTSLDYGSNPWRIGIGAPGGLDYGYPNHGVIDEARLYNRALSESEVLEQYNGERTKRVRIIRWQEAR